MYWNPQNQSYKIKKKPKKQRRHDVLNLQQDEEELQILRSEK